MNAWAQFTDTTKNLAKFIAAGEDDLLSKDGQKLQRVERCPVYVRRMVLKRSALTTTETELKLMAAAAIIGLRSR